MKNLNIEIKTTDILFKQKELEIFANTILEAYGDNKRIKNIINYTKQANRIKNLTTEAKLLKEDKKISKKTKTKASKK